MIRFRLQSGVEPFQDLIFGWNQHEVAQVGEDCVGPRVMWMNVNCQSVLEVVLFHRIHLNFLYCTFYIRNIFVILLILFSLIFFTMTVQLFFFYIVHLVFGSHKHTKIISFLHPYKIPFNESHSIVPSRIWFPVSVQSPHLPRLPPPLSPRSCRWRATPWS